MDNEKNEKCEMPKNTNYNLRKKKHINYKLIESDSESDGGEWTPDVDGEIDRLLSNDKEETASESDEAEEAEETESEEDGEDEVEKKMSGIKKKQDTHAECKEEEMDVLQLQKFIQKIFPSKSGQERVSQLEKIEKLQQIQKIPDKKNKSKKIKKRIKPQTKRSEIMSSEIMSSESK